jgi:hypothetical protein
MHNMKVAQMKELAQAEFAHRAQFREFSQAWDHYLVEFEQTAMEMMGQLKDRH